VLLAVPGTGHYLMNWAHLHVSLSVAGLLTLAIPVVSVLGAWLILDQHLTPVQALGGVVVLGVLAGVVRRDARLASRGGT
jgi:drug/metabolite transporter (DMT)-like permease